MLWRIIFSAVAISYLMCALFLSGLQKEDLDVSLLKKLQRYNVNIDEINTEQMKEKCITQSPAINLSKTKINIDNGEKPRIAFNKTRLQVETVKDTEQNKETYNDKKSQGSDIISPWTDHINISDKPMIEKNYTNTIEYTKGQPNIGSVMKFWEHYASSSNTQAKDSSIEIHKINTRRAEKNTKINIGTNQSDIIKNLLEQIKKLSKTEEPPIEITKKIYTESDNINTENFKISNIAQQIQHINYPLTARDTYDDKILHKHEEANVNLPEQNLTEIFKVIRQYSDKKQYEEMSRKPHVHKYEPPLNVKPLQQTSVEKSNVQNMKNKPDINPLVPEEVVKKIAQTVKDMVLRELRKEFLTTTTSTTPKAEIISISRVETYANEENIMEKFIEMFQNIKSQQKHSTRLLNNDKQISDEGDKNQQIIVKKTRFSFNPDVVVFTPMPYNLEPQLHKHKTEKKPIPRPITFQTNSLEIPPIGIPITHHQYPINQNIIVTTIAPYKAIQYESDNGRYSDSAPVKLYPKEIIQSPLSAKFVKRSDDCPLHHDCNHKNEDIIRFRLSNKGNSKYDTDYYEKINVGKIEPNQAYKDEKSPVLVPKFHEKLERPDAGDVFSDDDCCNSKYAMIPQKVDCCNQKIASRQQMSIANMKRGSYDDTHFRNFLKTQQKVTDMLEKILASRVKPDRPRSVETT